MKHIKIIAIATLMLLASGLAFTVWQSTAQEKAATSSTLITNLNGKFKETPIRREKVSTEIYDVSLVAYSKELVDRFALKTDRIFPMPEGLHAVELQVRTEGSELKCYMGFLFDSSLNVDYPKKEIINGDFRGVRLPSFKYQDQANEIYQFVSKRFRKFNYYDRNAYLASENYNPSAKNQIQIMMHPMILSYKNEFWPNMSFLKLDMLSCRNERLFQLKNTALWLKKKGGRDYTKFFGASYREDFFIFLLPKQFQEEVYSLLKQLPKDNFCRRQKS